jgi:hypothetical protein
MKPFGNTTGAETATLGDDLLHGAEAIAVFVFGNEKHRRKVYYYAGDAKVRLPVFRIGNVICARKSKLIEWIEAQEGAANAE